MESVISTNMRSFQVPLEDSLRLAGTSVVHRTHQTDWSSTLSGLLKRLQFQSGRALPPISVSAHCIHFDVPPEHSSCMALLQTQLESVNDLILFTHVHLGKTMQMTEKEVEKAEFDASSSSVRISLLSQTESNQFISL